MTGDDLKRIRTGLGFTQLKFGWLMGYRGRQKNIRTWVDRLECGDGDLQQRTVDRVEAAVIRAANHTNDTVTKESGR